MNFSERIEIGGRTVSGDSPVFIIAEAGVNHNGDMKLAHQLVDAACEAGVDAVKFQAFKTEQLVLTDAEKAPYQKKTTKGATQFEMLKALELDPSQLCEIRDYCRSKDLLFLATPFDDVSLETLADMEVLAYKVASTDLTNLPFLKRIAAKGKPVLLSTGMSFLDEVRRALEEIEPLNKDILLFQCTANYPIRDEEANLAVIPEFQQAFGILTGYSDHSVGIGASPYAVAAGACAIEKHFTLDRALPGPDHAASLTGAELRELVEIVRKAERYIGNREKAPTSDELGTRKSLQKSLVATAPIRKGELLTEENMTAKRAGGKGISPLRYKEIIGHPSPKDLEADDLIEV